MLISLQTELTQGQQEIASQRDELLQRLGGSRQIPVTNASQTQDSDIYTLCQSEAKVAPKPAASVAAGQFRKLRRDAKRRAIGA